MGTRGEGMGEIRGGREYDTGQGAGEIRGKAGWEAASAASQRAIYVWYGLEPRTRELFFAANMLGRGQHEAAWWILLDGEQEHHACLWARRVWFSRF